MAAGEAGLALSDFLELDAEECDAWQRFVFEGPSQLRTQMLLLQIVQIVGGALGAKNLKPAKMLPYIGALTPARKTDARQSMLASQRDAATRLLDHHLGKSD